MSESTEDDGRPCTRYHVHHTPQHNRTIASKLEMVQTGKRYHGVIQNEWIPHPRTVYCQDGRYTQLQRHQVLTLKLIVTYSTHTHSSQPNWLPGPPLEVSIGFRSRSGRGIRFLHLIPWLKSREEGNFILPERDLFVLSGGDRPPPTTPSTYSKKSLAPSVLTEVCVISCMTTKLQPRTICTDAAVTNSLRCMSAIMRASHYNVFRQLLSAGSETTKLVILCVE